MEVKTRNSEELQATAANFAAGISPHTRATVVALCGDLGAGKTTFAQGVAKALGVEEDVTSPTFVIEKIYTLKSRNFARLIHIDAYRLESPHELEVLGFRELLQDPSNLILVEWPEKAGNLIPEDAIKLRFDIHGDERNISINDGKEKNSG